MKKIISSVLVICLMFCFASCGRSVPDTLEQPTEAPTGDLKDTVTVNLPISFVDSEYRDNLEGYCKKYGYNSAKLSDDGQTVEIVMNQFSNELMKTDIGMQVLKKISEITDSGDYPYVKELVKVDKDHFREVIISVDQKGYKKAGTSAPFMIGQYCLLYQAYDSTDDYRCEVTVVDYKTSKVIDTLVYTDKDE
ncbi:MAG: hypothetical protein PUF31_08150 [Oscillospiraceae bacterium]|nr:hypothetical protein [Oscillospiraceae bacterium]